MPWDARLAEIDAVWRVVSLRITAFPVPGIEVEPLSSKWLTGDEPEDRRQQPKSRSSLEVANVIIGDRVRSARIVTTPFQTDLHLDESATSEEPEPAATVKPELMVASESLAKLRKLAAKWFGSEWPTTRIAFGAVLRKNAYNRREAYLALAEYLPFAFDAEETSDLVYQINRPRPSTVIPDLTLNRLNNWVVLTTHVVQFSADAMKSSATEPRIVSTDIQLTLDISSAASDVQLEAGTVPSLFDELIDLGLEIAADGDVP